MGDAELFDGGSAAASTTQKASGSYSYYFSNTNGYKNFTAIAEGYFKERLYINTVSTAHKFVTFRTGATTIGYVSMNGINQWIAVIGAGTVGTAVSSVNINTWYCLEVYFKVDGANGRFVVKVDGNTLIDFTGDTTVGAETDFDNLYFFGQGGMQMYIDDLALNSTAGGVDDSWIGGSRIEKITPSGNGAANEWTGSDGNAVDNYLLVDEYPSDGDTTYVYEATTETGDLDQYAMSNDFDGTNKTITRIWAECRAKKTSADAATLLIGFDTGASVNTDDVGALYESYSVRLVSAEYALNPDDAAAWEEADIDALEFVAEVG
jgi:hypothetical protein